MNSDINLKVLDSKSISVFNFQSHSPWTHPISGSKAVIGSEAERGDYDQCENGCPLWERRH